MKKRLCAVMTALVLCGSSVLSSSAVLPVKAASLPVALADEGAMLLWDIFIQCLLAAGITEALDYNDEVVLFTAFMDDLTLPENSYLFDTTQVRLVDGSTMTLKEALANGYMDGTGALRIPDEETWTKFRVIDGGGSGDSGDNQEPEGPYEEISDFTLNGAFFSYVADWIVSLWNGEVEGVNPDDYYFPSADELPQYQFKGEYEMDADGNYVIRGYAVYNRFQYRTLDIYSTSDCPVAAYLGTNSSNEPTIWFLKLLAPDSEYTTGAGVAWTETYYNPSDGSFIKEVSNSSGHLNYNEYYSLNIPVFNSHDECYAYLRGTSTTAPANGLAYDYAALAEALPAVLSPLTDVTVSPNALPAVNAAIRAAAHALPEPEPAIDPAENTETYVQAVTDAVVAVAPDVVPDAAPEIDPALDPTDIEIVNNYKFDLTQVFPFCLPFDLIRFLEALAADPEAPRFEIPFVVPALGMEEVYVLDLSFMDEVMEIVRFCELVGFCFALIMLTPKMIKW